MAVSVTEDIVAGMKIRQNKLGYWAERLWHFIGMDPTAPPAIVFGGTYPRAGGGFTTIPVYSSDHPFLIGTYCIEVEQYPVSKDAKGQLYVRAAYGPGELINQWKVTISGSNGTKTLTVDSSGNPFKLQYTPTDGPVQIDYPTFQYLAPGSIITFEHEQYTGPLAAINAIKSCTNSSTFLGQPPHHVLCRDVVAESLRSMTAWRIKYVFEIAPDPLGWKQIALFTDRYTGQIPGDIDFTSTDGTAGQLIIDPYEQMGLTYDFTSLGLPTSLL